MGVIFSRGGDGDGSVTPLPRVQMLVAICILTSEASCYSYMFPFIPFMVRGFGVEEENVGYYSGWYVRVCMSNKNCANTNFHFPENVFLLSKLGEMCGERCSEIPGFYGVPEAWYAKRLFTAIEMTKRCRFF
jgi:hypothetical protein